jgi:hypothetical protein
LFASPVSGDELTYSHEFIGGTIYRTGSAQFEDWLSFRASLPDADVTSITVSGSLDPVGRTCSDPVKAQLIADAMFLGASEVGNATITQTLECDGFFWNTGACSIGFTNENNLELNVGPNIHMCFCELESGINNNYTVRPGIADTSGVSSSWGGITGPTCEAPTQTMTVTINVRGNDADGDGVPDEDDVCPATAAAALVEVRLPAPVTTFAQPRPRPPW